MRTPILARGREPTARGRCHLSRPRGSLNAKRVGECHAHYSRCTRCQSRATSRPGARVGGRLEGLSRPTVPQCPGTVECPSPLTPPRSLRLRKGTAPPPVNCGRVPFHLSIALFWMSRGVSDSDRKSTRLNSSHGYISYAVFCLKKKKKSQ